MTTINNVTVIVIPIIVVDDTGTAINEGDDKGGSRNYEMRRGNWETK